MPVAKDRSPIPQRLGPYILGKRLGGGGMGDVYEASHVMMRSRRVAIKLLKPQLADKPQLVQRFLREISALGGVKAHANLVRAEFADLADNVPYLVMEYVEGIDLSQVINRQGPLSVADACNCMLQATQGLDAIHQAGLVHRDLKPSNLMLTNDGVVKILDLGLARLQISEGPADELTSANSVLGTMDYTAPEQAEDPRMVDIRADIYSLGCTMYKLLTGQVPYAEFSTMAQKIRAHASVPFPKLPERIPPELQLIVAKMAAKNPGDRYAQPADLIEALRPFCTGSTLQVPPLVGPTLQEELPQDTSPQDVKQTISYDVAAPIAATKTKAAPQRWSRRTKLATLAGLLVVLFFGAFAAIGWLREPADPYDVDNLEPMKWHPLFIREPMKLVWTKADKAGHTHFDAGMQQFFVTNHDRAYFKLGTTKKRNYKFQVTISTNAWERVGIVFGYRTPQEDSSLGDDEVAHFQFVGFDVVGEKPTLVLERGRSKSFHSKGGAIQWSSLPLAMADLADRPGEKVLEISVSEKNLVRVSLDNVDLKELAIVGPGELILDEDFSGTFGVFTNNNSCHFRDAKFYIMSGSN